MFFLFILCFSVSSCEHKDTKKKELDFANDPYLDAIHNSSTADNPEDSSHRPAIHFLEQEFDFGTIQEGDSVFHDFKFVNTGNARLLLTNVSSTCGCTLPFWPKGFIRQADTGSIHIIFNSTEKVGDQVKPITVTANTSPIYHVIKLKGKVLAKKGVK